MKFYATFMQRQATKLHYVEIEAENVQDAHAAMHEHFGTTWAFMYDEAGFSGQVQQFGLKRLIGIKVTDHGSSVEYQILPETLEDTDFSIHDRYYASKTREEA